MSEKAKYWALVLLIITLGAILGIYIFEGYPLASYLAGFNTCILANSVRKN